MGIPTNPHTTHHWESGIFPCATGSTRLANDSLKNSDACIGAGCQKTLVPFFVPPKNGIGAGRHSVCTATSMGSGRGGLSGLSCLHNFFSASSGMLNRTQSLFVTCVLQAEPVNESHYRANCLTLAPPTHYCTACKYEYQLRLPTCTVNYVLSAHPPL